MTLTAFAVIGLALLLAFAFMLILGLAQAAGKPTPPPPDSLQGRADALRALGDEFDAMWQEPAVPAHRRPAGGWGAPGRAERRGL